MEIIKDSAGNPLPWLEPGFCDLFYEKTGKLVWGGYISGKWQGYVSETDFYLKDNCLGAEILHASRIARTPMPTADAVADFPYTEEEIDALYQKAKDWMSNQ